MTITKPLEIYDDLKIRCMFSINFNIFSHEFLLFRSWDRKCTYWFITDWFLVTQTLFDKQLIHFNWILSAIKKECMTVYHCNLWLTIPFIKINLDTNISNQRDIRIKLCWVLIKKQFTIFWLLTTNTWYLNKIFLVKKTFLLNSF
jgi:hypothetical protein